MGLLLLVVASLLGLSSAADNGCIAIYGYSSCAYFQRAKCWGDALAKNPDKWTVATIGGTRDEYQAHLARLKGLHSSIDPSHRTSPLVMRGCEKPMYVGGSDAFVAMLKNEGISAEGCW